jgi:hypothetical protein
MSAVASRGALWFTAFLDRLDRQTRRFLRRRQRQPHIVRSYFRTRHVRYAIIQATEHLRLNMAGGCIMRIGPSP